MSNDDDWYEKYMKDRMQRDKGKFQQSGNPNDLPHYRPNHDDLDIEKLLQGVPSNPMRNQAEADPLAILQQRLANGQLQNQQYQQMPGRPSPQAVQLREGFEFYKMVHKATGDYKVNIVRKVGLLQNVSNKQFVLRGEERCFELKGNETLDLGKVKPENLRALVAVETTFEGVILVPRQAIIEQGPGNNGKTLLKG